MGANVIKIEDPVVGDYARTLGAKANTNAWLFLLVNRNKRGLRLDLKQSAGREIFLTLARKADIIVESFRPGVMDKLGVGYETVRAVNPRIVYCAITGYGQTGPYRDKAGHDLNYCAYAGISEQIGTPDDMPAIPNFQIGDLLGGSLSAVMGILAAVIDAQRSGIGRYIDIAMADCVLAHTLFPLISQQASGKTPPRGQDFLSGALPCYSIYETADGRYMAVAALEKKFWERCCETLQRPDLIQQHLVFGTEAHEVRAELAAIFKSQPQSYWIAIFDKVDCCVTPLLSMSETMENAQFKARDMFITINSPLEGSVTQFAFPIKFSDFTFAVEHQAPMPGEHTMEILSKAGFTTEQIAQMKTDGVI
jgi:crotonobetainyl-CoA:carnitine CoA-transferase CaiB-like acyl-CoA transferase